MQKVVAACNRKVVVADMITRFIRDVTLHILCRKGGWSKALLALFACHPKFLASAKSAKSAKLLKKSIDFMYNRQPGQSHPHLGMF